MSQFSCQGVSLPSSEENQGREKRNLAGTWPGTHGDVRARPTGDEHPSPPTRGEMGARRCLEQRCAPGMSQLPPASQLRARQGEQPAPRLGVSLSPHSSQRERGETPVLPLLGSAWLVPRGSAAACPCAGVEQAVTHGSGAGLRETKSTSQNPSIPASISKGRTTLVSRPTASPKPLDQPSPVRAHHLSHAHAQPKPPPSLGSPKCLVTTTQLSTTSG